MRIPKWIESDAVAQPAGITAEVATTVTALDHTVATAAKTTCKGLQCPAAEAQQQPRLSSFNEMFSSNDKAWANQEGASKDAQVGDYEERAYGTRTASNKGRWGIEPRERDRKHGYSV